MLVCLRFEMFSASKEGGKWKGGGERGRREGEVGRS